MTEAKSPQGGARASAVAMTIASVSVTESVSPQVIIGQIEVSPGCWWLVGIQKSLLGAYVAREREKSP
jgi:hypothetical protein